MVHELCLQEAQVPEQSDGEESSKKSSELESRGLQVSQTATLAFLAVWHGWHAGYYVTFFNEFIVISFEKDFSTVWNKSVRVARCWFINANVGEWMSHSWFVLLISNLQVEGASCLHHCHHHHWLVKDSILLALCSWMVSSDRCYVLFFLPHCFLAFPLLGWNRFWPVYQVKWEAFCCLSPMSNLFKVSNVDQYQEFETSKLKLMPFLKGLYFIIYLFFMGYPAWGKLARSWLLSNNPPREEKDVNAVKEEWCLWGNERHNVQYLESLTKLQARLL